MLLKQDKISSNSNNKEDGFPHKASEAIKDILNRISSESGEVYILKMDLVKYYNNIQKADVYKRLSELNKGFETTAKKLEEVTQILDELADKIPYEDISRQRFAKFTKQRGSKRKWGVYC